MKSGLYEVIVSNIGCTHSGRNEVEARKHYKEYVEQSKSNYGRAGGEEVKLMRDGEPIVEYFGKTTKEEIY